MFDSGGDKVIFGRQAGQGHPLEDHVVGFAAAAGENDSPGRSSQQIGQLAAGLFQSGFGFPALPVNGGRVARALLQTPGHGFGDFGMRRRGGVVVQVNPMDSRRAGLGPGQWHGFAGIQGQGIL